MRKRVEFWMDHHPLAKVVVVMLVVFAFCGVARSDNPITANLIAYPKSHIVKPGGSVRFMAEVFHNPAFPQAPGTKIRCWVTRDDFSWVSDKQEIKYPEPGGYDYREFVSTFPIPSNAESGQVFNFFLVYGIWYPMSDKVSVKVFIVKPVLKKK